MEKRAISLAEGELEDKAEQARLADAARFDVIWSSGGSIPAFGVMVANVHQGIVGTGVLRAFAHDVRNLALHSADLHQLSSGRFILGLGGGTKRMNINQLGQEFDHPATRLRELIKVLRQIWMTPTKEQVAVDGAYYPFRGPGLGTHAYPGSDFEKPPIYLAAVNTSMFRLAGELCEGLCGHPIASVPFIQQVAWPEIDAGLRRAGRTRESFDHQSWINCAISSDRTEALRELKFHVGRFLATRSYSMVLDSLGLQKDRIAIQEAFFGHPGDSEALISSVTDEVALAHGLAGTPDEVRQQAKRYDGVIDVPVYYSASALMSKDRVRENINNMIVAFGR